MPTSPSKSAANASWPCSLHSVTGMELAKLERDLITASPLTLAMATSLGRWKPARHLACLDRQLLAAIDDSDHGALDGLVVSMPPQHGKSELCSRYLPAWYLGTFPDRRVILTGYEADFAAQWGRKARDILAESGRLFGVQVSKTSAATHRWDIENHPGGMTTAGVGGPITGKGAHLLIVDDPIKNDEEARSPLHRRKLWDWWQSTASTRIRPGGLFLIIQTRWHRDDLAGRILRESQTNGQRWREVRLPALAEDNDPLGRAPGEPLWPDVYTREHLERVRQGQTPYFWNALYQQSPIAEGATEFPDDWFGPSIWFDEWPAESNRRVIALDPSKGKESKHGDYSAFVLVQVAGDTYYVDADLDHCNLAALADKSVELAQSFRADSFSVETNMFQELLADEIHKRFEARRLETTLYCCTNHVSKRIRIRRLTTLLAEGRVKFKSHSRGSRLLVDQLRAFPLGDHDDGPDALEMAHVLIEQHSPSRANRTT